MTEIKVGDKYKVLVDRVFCVDAGAEFVIDGVYDYAVSYAVPGVAPDGACSLLEMERRIENGFCELVKPVTYNVTFNTGSLSGEAIERAMGTWRDGMSSVGRVAEAMRESIATPPVLRRCGCGKHDIDPAGDLYAQHREWVGHLPHAMVERRFPFLALVPGVGVSAVRCEAQVDEQWGEEFER